MSKFVNKPSKDDSIINQDNDKQTDDLNKNSFEEGKRSNYICCLESKKEHVNSSDTEEHSDTQHYNKIPNNDDEKTGSDQAKSTKKFSEKYPVKEDEKLKEDNEEEEAFDEEKSESSTPSKTIANSPPSSCEISKPKSNHTTLASQDSSPSKQ